jgi:hypothetical protein
MLVLTVDDAVAVVVEVMLVVVEDGAEIDAEIVVDGVLVEVEDDVWDMALDGDDVTLNVDVGLTNAALDADAVPVVDSDIEEDSDGRIDDEGDGRLLGGGELVTEVEGLELELSGAGGVTLGENENDMLGVGDLVILGVTVVVMEEVSEEVPVREDVKEMLLDADKEMELDGVGEVPLEGVMLGVTLMVGVTDGLLVLVGVLVTDTVGDEDLEAVKDGESGAITVREALFTAFLSLPRRLQHNKSLPMLVETYLRLRWTLSLWLWLMSKG